MTRLRGVAALLGCLVVALVLAAVVPDPATDARRRYVTAVPGSWATTATVSARVDQVVVARSVQRDYGDPFVSRQALVVVGVDAQVRGQVVRFSQVTLRARDDRDYEPRPEFSTAGLGLTQPGFTRHATLVFEVPPQRLAGAALVIDADSAAVDGYADAIRVDLRLDEPVAISPAVAAAPASTVSTT